MKLSDFDYALPDELIASHPLCRRDSCRLLVLERSTGRSAHKIFSDLPAMMRPGDCLVLNNTRVLPARLFGKRKTGGKVELFLLERSGMCGEALLRPSGRVKEGESVLLESGDTIEILGRGTAGRLVRSSRPLDEVIAACGHIPLPPYLGREDEPSDRADYQTVFASRDGATASPTAGLHFTEALFRTLADAGVVISQLTLHTSYGTFAPVKCDDLRTHTMHREYFELPKETIDIVKRTKDAGKAVWAVGTTSARVLEWCASDILQGKGPVKGYTDLFIYPGYGFKVVDKLITNFHLPKSTLLLLVSAFAGKESIFRAYAEAVERKYRFFSYGDAMVIV